jgi:hypothetical protein
MSGLIRIAGTGALFKIASNKAAVASPRNGSVPVAIS